MRTVTVAQTAVTVTCLRNTVLFPATLFVPSGAALLRCSGGRSGAVRGDDTRSLGRETRCVPTHGTHASIQSSDKNAWIVGSSRESG